MCLSSTLPILTPLRVQIPAVHLLTRRFHPEDQTLPGEREQPADGEAGGPAGPPRSRKSDRRDDEKPRAGKGVTC